MDSFQEQIFEFIGRIKENELNQRTSKAAAVPRIETPCQYLVANNPDMIRSKAASVTSPGPLPGQYIPVNKLREIVNFFNRRY